MSIYTDPMTVQTEIDRRFELAGVDPYNGHDLDHDRHRRDLPSRPLGAHPLAAFVAGLVRGSRGSAPAALSRSGAACGTAQHP